MARTISSGDYFSVGDVAAVDLTGAFTLAGWYYPNSLSSIDLILGKDNGGEGGCQYILGSNGTSGYIQIGAAGVGNQYGLSGGTLSTGAWNHVAGTHNAAALEIFVGGLSGATATAPFTPQNTAEPLLLGRRGNGFNADGPIAEIGIWDVVLTASEIAALGKGFSPALIRPQSLQGYWPLIGNGSPEPDIKKGNGATVVGSPTKARHPRIIVPRSALYVP